MNAPTARSLFRAGTLTLAALCVTALFLMLLAPSEAKADCIDYGDYLHSLASLDFMNYSVSGVAVKGDNATKGIRRSSLPRLMLDAFPQMFFLCTLMASSPSAAQANCIDYGNYIRRVGSLTPRDVAYGDVAVSGNIVYVMDDYDYNYGALRVIDVSNPSSPTLLGSFEGLSRGNGITISGTYVYWAGVAGLQVLDVSNPASPKVVGSVLTPGWGVNVVVSDTLAYVADGSTTLAVIDISNPVSPRLLGTVDRPSGYGSASGVALSGSIAYVADNLLQVINVSDPSHPVILKSIDTPGWAQEVALSGTFLYVTASDYGFVQGLQVFDVSNPTSPALVSSLLIPHAGDIGLSGSIAYVAGDSSAIKAIDVSNPLSPVIIGSVGLPGASGVAASGTMVFVAAGSSGLQVIDASNPSSPDLLGNVDTSALVSDVKVSDARAYVAGEAAGLQIVDVSNSAHPSLLGSVVTPTVARGVDVAGNLAYVATDYLGLQVVDVSNPMSPAILGSVDTPGWAENVVVSGTLAYVADGPEGLQVIDVSNASSPSILGSASMPTSVAHAVAVTGNLAYVVDDDLLHVIDVSNPRLPIHLTSISTVPPPPPWSNNNRGVAVAGTIAYVAGSDLVVVDVSNPELPKIMGRVGIPGLHYLGLGGATDVTVSGTMAYVSDGSWGLQVIDVSDPSFPFIVGTSDTRGSANGIAVAGNVVYLAGGTDGLITLPAQCSPSVSVGLADFQAVSEPGAIELRWAASSGADLAGFHVLRSAGAEAFERITASLLSASGPYTFRDESVRPGQTYAYRLEALDRGGASTFFGPYYVTAGLARNRLGLNQPNPFHAGDASTRIDFETAHQGRTTLRILDVSGAQVRALVDGYLPAGSHNVIWDGRDAHGRPVASGTYFYQLVSGTFLKTKRLVVIP